MTVPQAPRTGERILLTATFADAARRYWTGVFPQIAGELSHWHDRAGEIPDPALRRLALDAQRKRGNIEGAAAFATFAPHHSRTTVVRALVALQAAYDYLDVLAEQPQPDPVAGARGLHEALLDSLDPALGTVSQAARQHDYYAQYPQDGDGGYLAELVDTCRTALAKLPSYPVVAAIARRSAARILEFQSLNLSKSQGDHDALARWGRAQTPAASDLRWWESAAAGGSPLGLYALIAAAADPAIATADAEAIEHAYFPWIGGLHSLLDHLVDRSEDAAAGQRNLIDYYASPQEAAIRMQALAAQSVFAARALLRGRQHTVMLAGMAGYYLSSPEASAPGARPIARNLRETIGGLTTPTLFVFKARRLAGHLAARPRRGIWETARPRASTSSQITS
jgi:tetraprenyl-beta-curcumene synthase